MINYWSYKKEYKKNNKKYLKNINKVLQKGNIFFGDQLKKFEKTFIKKYKSKYGIAVGSGTDALLISLISLKLKKNTEVIVPANTAIPTISAIINAGYKPKLVDVGNDYLIDTKKLETEINKRTKVIIPVHLYGQSCQMDKIIKLAKKYNLRIIEDCAQSQGAKFSNKFVGTFGDFGCFSFYPTKILGAYGDGGFIITNNFNLYEKIKRIRFYGIETNNKKNKFYNEYYANENGVNSRLDEIQSTILNLKIPLVNTFIKKRRILAKIYLDQLKNTALKLPIENKYCHHVYNVFTVFHKDRSKIIRKLKLKKVGTRIIYPHAIHKMKAYKKLLKSKSLINVEKFSKGIFSLPLHPELNKNDIYNICKKLTNIITVKSK